jgi:hypothetical protein
MNLATRMKANSMKAIRIIAIVLACSVATAAHAQYPTEDAYQRGRAQIMHSTNADEVITIVNKAGKCRLLSLELPILRLRPDRMVEGMTDRQIAERLRIDFDACE